MNCMLTAPDALIDLVSWGPVTPGRAARSPVYPQFPANWAIFPPIGAILIPIYNTGLD